MTNLKFTFIFLLFCFGCFGQNQNTHKVDPAAVKLNNDAMTLVYFINDNDSSKKALILLDSSTVIDSNYFIGRGYPDNKAELIELFFNLKIDSRYKNGL